MMSRGIPKYIVVIQKSPYETTAVGYSSLKEARSRYAEDSARYHVYLTKVIE